MIATCLVVATFDFIVSVALGGMLVAGGDLCSGLETVTLNSVDALGGPLVRLVGRGCEKMAFTVSPSGTPSSSHKPQLPSKVLAHPRRTDSLGSICALLRWHLEHLVHSA